MMQPQHTRVKENLGEFEDVALDESNDDVALDESNDDVALVKESYGKIDEEEFEDVALDESPDVTLVKESYEKINEELVKEQQHQGELQKD
ncbi:hypothetical protein ACFX2I_016121 [Malus domestica]